MHSDRKDQKVYIPIHMETLWCGQSYITAIPIPIQQNNSFTHFLSYSPQIIPPLMFYHIIQITLFPLLHCFRSRKRASRTYLIFRKTPKAFIAFSWESCTPFLFYTMHTRTLLSLVSRIKMHNIYFVTLRVKDILFD